MRKLSQSEFVSACIKVHGDRYLLNKVEYKNARGSIIVTCREHGDFNISAKTFLYSKCGCPSCTFNGGKASERFKEAATAVHGDRFDYSKVSYKRHNVPVSIVCKEHGEFLQLTHVHLRGSSCPRCSNVAKIDTAEFIRRSIELFGDKYDYSKTAYKKSTEKVSLVCKKHGAFEQYPNNHLTGKGCRKCACEDMAEKKKMSESEAHSVCQKNGVTLVLYSGNARDPSSMMCEHGHSWMAPVSRISTGSGCPSCSTSGYDPRKPGHVYVLISTCGAYMKIGLSNKPKTRIRTLRTTTPMQFYVHGVAKMQGWAAPKFETQMHKRSVSAGFSGFDGCTEWFKFDKSIADEIRFFNR